MSKALVSESKLTAIADAVRSKTGGQTELTLDEIAAAISEIQVSSADVLVPIEFPTPDVTITIT